MPRSVLEFRVVVASPSDLFETRKAVFEVIDELNRTFEVQKVAIRGLGWEEYVTPGIASSAQALINSQLLTEYDILIAIFATKLGTPTPSARSGTIEEIEHAIANTASSMGKYRVQVYFRDKLDSTTDLSIEEFKSVLDYREALKPRGILFGTFKDHADLQREIRVNIQRPILDFLKAQGVPTTMSSALEQETHETTLTTTEIGNPGELVDTEEFGLLDYQERAEQAIGAFNVSMERMAKLVSDIGAEMDRSVAQISDAAFVNYSTQQRKKVINDLSSFLKDKALELQKEAGAATEYFDTYASTIILMAKLEREDNKVSYDRGLTIFLAEAERMLTSTMQARHPIASFRNSVANMPRITIQFNQAKKMLIQACDDSLKLLDRTEKSIYEITAGT